MSEVDSPLTPEMRAFMARHRLSDAVAYLLLSPSGYGLTLEQADWAVAQLRMPQHDGRPPDKSWPACQWWAERARTYYPVRAETTTEEPG